MMLKIQLSITEINYILKYTQTENSYWNCKKCLTVLLLLLHFWATKWGPWAKKKKKVNQAEIHRSNENSLK